MSTAWRPIGAPMCVAYNSRAKVSALLRHILASASGEIKLMTLSHSFIRFHARWLILVMAVFLLVACGGEEYVPDDTQSVSQQEDQPAEDDWYYAETPEDCLDDEEFDEVDELCYQVIDCDVEDCQDDGPSIAQSFFDLVDELAWGVSGTGFEDSDALEENTLVTYRVEGNQITTPELAAVSDDLLDEQADTETHQRMWAYFTQLIPLEQREYLTGYQVFTDGPDETLAFVTADTDDPHNWVLGIDIADSSDLAQLSFTLVHEFAHLLTLNSDQVPADEELAMQPDDQDLYDEAVAACPTYFPGEGCSHPDSYINAFFERFWVDEYQDWQEVDQLQYEDEEEYATALEDFYALRSDEFVSDYAATNPGEDIAESFATFVLQPAPTGTTIADDKVAFFYDYPELVKLRSEIMGRMYSRLRRR